MRVKLVVDGKDVPLNRFVQEILGRMLAGAVSALHGVDAGWKSIELSIFRE
ncbi:MAG: hypothetical protein OD814_000367 [Candidatus Alkanophagales archaeon MCA70_species_1]|nr:hypothetical protein [Candidatus Alkanophaga volatiphilum]